MLHYILFRRKSDKIITLFRGQGIGIAKEIVSLSMFHQGRIFLTESFKEYNKE